MTWTEQAPSQKGGKVMFKISRNNQTRKNKRTRDPTPALKLIILLLAVAIIIISFILVSKLHTLYGDSTVLSTIKEILKLFFEKAVDIILDLLLKALKLKALIDTYAKRT